MSLSIGKRIKMLREKKEFTLEHVAKCIGVATQTIHKYEKEVVTNIPLDTIERLAEVFEVSPAYLMGWVDEEEPPTQREDDITDIIIRLRRDEKFLNLVETLNEYPEERIDAISAMISAFDK